MVSGLEIGWRGGEEILTIIIVAILDALEP